MNKYNKHLYSDLIKLLQYGGKKQKYLIATLDPSDWSCASDSTARNGGSSVINVNKSVLGLHIFGILGALQGSTKKHVGFGIAENKNITLPKVRDLSRFYFKAVFDERINYLMRVITYDLAPQESYVAPITFSNNNKIYISFSHFRPTYRGNYFNGKSLDISKIKSVGIQINRSNQTDPNVYNMIPLKFKFTLLSGIYMK